jgi:pectate lyase
MVDQIKTRLINLKSVQSLVAWGCLFYAAGALAQNTVNGFASVAGEGLSTTTGGGNATAITVTNYSGLSSAVSGGTPRVIIISGTINTTDGGGYALAVGPNKTLKGADKVATIYGGIALSSNTIVQNLNLQGTYPNSGPDDVLHVQGVGVHHIWIDHCNISDATDGNLDITGQASYCTVSWCKFFYTNPTNGHRLSCLIGSGGGDHPEDWGYLKVTYHHNWFADLVHERMPRLMYGQAHTYNDYYTCSGDLYCIGVGSYGSMLIENNYFKNVSSPHIFMYDVWCYIVATNNIYDNCTGTENNGLGGSADATGQSFPVQAFTNPPYSYILDSAANIPNLVTNGAGPQAQSPVPSSLVAIPGDGQISLSWSPAVAATNYIIKRSTTNGSGYVNIATSAATVFTDTGLMNGTAYYYVVSALSTNGESANSGQAGATPQIPAPTGLVASGTNAQVTLTWNASAGAINYIVKQATVNGGPYNNIATNSTTTYTNTGLLNGVTYFYVVSAVGVNGESANSTQASALPLNGGGSALFAYEGFNYPSNTTIANLSGGSGWGATWGTATDPASALATNSPNGLNYGNGTVRLVTTGGSVIVGNPSGPASTTAQIQRRLFDTLTNLLHGGGSVWISFLYQNLQTSKGAMAGYRETGIRLMSGATINVAGYSDRNGTDKVDAGSPNTYPTGSGFDELSLFLAPTYSHNGYATPRGSDPTNVVLVLMRLDVDTTTNNDTAYTWFFQNGNGLSSEPNTNSALSFTTAELSGVNALRFQAGNFNANGTNAYWALDEIRVGGTYADVTPTTFAGNTPPTLQPISDRTINVGYNLSITNNATDSDVPAQTLTYTLPTGPAGATINSSNGIVNWRPDVSFAGSVNAFSVVVIDSGSPNMSATQNFLVVINPVTSPGITSPVLNNGQIGFTVNGDVGPDYAVQNSSNLMNWNTLFITNPAVMPFTWSTNTAGNVPSQFYRIKVGPPLP